MLLGGHSALGREFFLDTLGLLTCLVLSNFLLLLEDALVCGVHLEVGLQLRHLNRLSVPKSDYVVERQDQVECFLQDQLLIDV